MEIQREIVNYSNTILNSIGGLVDFLDILVFISAIIWIIWLMKNRNQNRSKEKELIEWGNTLKKGTK